MSRLTGQVGKAIENENLVVRCLEREYGWKGWLSPFAERIDFTLGNDNFVNVVGEIKTRDVYHPEGWFVAKKKIEALAAWKKVLVNASPWFCVYCTENNFIYVLDLDTDFKRSPFEMHNKFSVENADDSGFIVPLHEWQTIATVSP